MPQLIPAIKPVIKHTDGCNIARNMIYQGFHIEIDGASIKGVFVFPTSSTFYSFVYL